MDSIQIKWKSTTDISNSVHWDSLQLTLVLTKEVSKVQFYIHATSSDPVLSVNDQIDVYQNGSHIFGGTVTEMETTIAGSAGILPEVLITATDWSFKLNKKLVAKAYALMDPADIVIDLLANFTDGTYTHTHVQRGNFLVPSIKFNYEPVTKCIQALASLIGWDWNVDPSKDVHFFISENNPAPFGIDDTSGNLEWPTLDIDIDLTNMKNSVYVIGSTYLKTFTAANTNDKFNTDGIKTAYGLFYVYENDGNFTVKVNGVIQTMGIENQVTDPSTVQILWNPLGRYIVFTAGAPASGESVVVYGNAKVPIVAHAQDSTAISKYGEIQDAVVDKQIKTIQEAQQRAQAEVEQYGHAVYTVKFNTLMPGLIVGQTIVLNSVKLGYLNIPLTIRRLTGNGYSPTNIEWQVECFGSDQVSFVDMMAGVLQQEMTDNDVDDTTILEALQVLAEQLNLTDVAFVNSEPPPYIWGPGGIPAIIWGLFTWSADDLADNFETESAGNLNGQNGWAGDASFQVQTSVKNSGTKAIAGNATTDVNIVKIGGLKSDGFQTIFISGNSASGGIVHLYEGSTQCVMVRFGPWLNNDISYNNGSGFVQLASSFTQNTFYQLDIQWRGNDHKVRYRINQGAWSAWDTPVASWTNGIDRIMLRTAQGAGGISYFDDLSMQS